MIAGYIPWGLITKTPNPNPGSPVINAGHDEHTDRDSRMRRSIRVLAGRTPRNIQESQGLRRYEPDHVISNNMAFLTFEGSHSIVYSLFTSTIDNHTSFFLEGQILPLLIKVL